MLSHVYPFLSTCRRNPSSSSLHYIWHQSGGGRTSNHGKAHLLLCLLIHLLYSITACDLVLGDRHYNTPDLREDCEHHGRLLVATQYGKYPHTDDGVEVRRIFHKLRSTAIENFNEHFKGIFDGQGKVPSKGLVATQRFALGAIFVYQLALWYRFEHGLERCVGLKAFLKAA